ncbi:MAG: cation-translocating P-type ATPase [Bacteroidota bacterium]
MTQNHFNIQGLTGVEVIQSRKINGKNSLKLKENNVFIELLKSLLSDPMLLLLLIAAAIYFFSGDMGDGIFMLCAILFEVTISVYQNRKSKNALDKLKKYSQAKCKVIREGAILEIESEELVIGDCLMIEEGTSITADGIIIHSNDFSVNESIITGESLPLNKDKSKDNNIIYQGTTVASGLAVAKISAIGNATELGKIGQSLDKIKDEKTPLEAQISNFVKKMVIIGAIVFTIVWLLNFYYTKNALESLLKSLTLAMSIIPEEIPFAFSTFMALGAWRLMKLGIVVKQMKTVETLGSATVICTDKTGTLTENKMSLAKIYVPNHLGEISSIEGIDKSTEKELIRIAMFASEPIPFDPMELALHETYVGLTPVDERKHYHMIHEYPLSGKPPMMTHVFENDKKERIVATKGAAEAIIQLCNLTIDEVLKAEKAIETLSGEGYRLLAVAQAKHVGNEFPKTQQEFTFDFKGIIAFYDPPKSHIKQVLNDFYHAGISVKIITGDNALTTHSIARQIGFIGWENSISGDELMALNEAELKNTVKRTNVYTRMFPEAKLKIINALKSNNEVVAMTGDGVNDGPALKAAHIGIAMGKKGTDIAKQAASLILLEDDLSKMVEAIAMGRKIYSNLKKAIQYIISIHIPIILTVFIPLALGWVYPNIFSPVHVIFLELIMGPTCSIIYENEPIEKNLMKQKPRPFSNAFFSWRELGISIIQGLIITLGILFIYQSAVNSGYNESTTRTMIFLTLISANVFLTLVNRSFHFSILKTIGYKNNMVLLIISITCTLTATLIYLPKLVYFFSFERLNAAQLTSSILVGFISVIWFEFVKWWNRKKQSSVN